VYRKGGGGGAEEEDDDAEDGVAGGSIGTEEGVEEGHDDTRNDHERAQVVAPAIPAPAQNKYILLNQKSTINDLNSFK
jgi:hypothetical protein